MFLILLIMLNMLLVILARFVSNVADKIIHNLHMVDQSAKHLLVMHLNKFLLNHSSSEMNKVQEKVL